MLIARCHPDSNRGIKVLQTLETPADHTREILVFQGLAVFFVFAEGAKSAVRDQFGTFWNAICCLKMQDHRLFASIVSHIL